MSTVWVVLTEHHSSGKSHDFFEAVCRAVNNASKRSAENLLVIKVMSTTLGYEELEKRTRMNDMGTLVTAPDTTVEEKGVLTGKFITKTIVQGMSQAQRMLDKMEN